MCSSALHSAGKSASVPGGCSASCCAWWMLLREPLEPGAACEWNSGADCELGCWLQGN